MAGQQRRSFTSPTSATSNDVVEDVIEAVEQAEVAVAVAEGVVAEDLLEHIVIALHHEAERVIATILPALGEHIAALSRQVDQQTQQAAQRFNDVITEVKNTEYRLATLATSVADQKPVLLDIQAQIDSFVSSGATWAQAPGGSVDLDVLRQMFLLRIEDGRMRRITEQLFAETLVDPTQVDPAQLRAVWAGATTSLLAEIHRETPGPARAARRAAVQGIVPLLEHALRRFHTTAQDLAGLTHV